MNISRKNPQRKAGQVYAPLYSAVKKYLREERIPLHVPLHGRGPGAPDLFRKGFHSLMRLDLTELGPLDDLHLPRGALKSSSRCAALQRGGNFFLVNGVTGGLRLILSFAARDKVLLSRLAHKRCCGIALGALPIYLPVEMDKPTGFPLNVSLDSVRKACPHPDARLLLLLLHRE